jgi:flagellar biosynthesis protein FlhG
LSKAVSDQADGLRRLMARGKAQLVAVVGSGPGTGATSIVLNLAAALAQQGKRVLLLDEQAGPGSASAIWQVAAAGTWADVAAQRLRLEAAVGIAACGVEVLPAPPGAQPAGVDPRALLQERVVLIDAALDSDGALSSLARVADDVVVVLKPEAASITAAYACVKRLHYAHALQRMRILVNCARSESEAQRIHANLKITGSRYLALALEAAGHVTDDARLPHARQLQQDVVEAFPASQAAVDFRRLAMELPQWPLRMQGRRAVAPVAARAGQRESGRLVEFK